MTGRAFKRRCRREDRKGRRHREVGRSRRVLMLGLRPMTLADLQPGYPYEPGLSLLEIYQPAAVGADGLLFHVPILLPPERRATTEENAKFAFHLACARDPEVAAVVDRMHSLAPFEKDVAPEASIIGGFIIPPAMEQVP